MPKTEINRFLGIGQNTIESDHIFLALKRGDKKNSIIHSRLKWTVMVQSGRPLKAKIAGPND